MVAMSLGTRTAVSERARSARVGSLGSRAGLGRIGAGRDGGNVGLDGGDLRARFSARDCRGAGISVGLDTSGRGRARGMKVEAESEEENEEGEDDEEKDLCDVCAAVSTCASCVAIRGRHRALHLLETKLVL